MKDLGRISNPYNDGKVIASCGLFGMMSLEGRTFSGRDILKAIANMNIRGNGLGGGLAVYGIYPDHRDMYALHIMFEDRRGRELVKQLTENDVTAGISTINNASNDGLDLRQFNREIVEYLRMLLLVKTGSTDSAELTVEDINELKELAGAAGLPMILKAVKRFGQLDLSLDNYSTLPLELALVDCTLPEPAQNPEPVRQSEPPPVTRKSAPKAAAPPPEPPAASVKEPKAEKAAAVKPPHPVSEPEPPVAEPVAAEEPTTTANESVAASPLAAGSAIEQLQSQWSTIINDAPGGLSKTPAAALLRSALPKTIEDNTQQITGIIFH